MDVKSLFRQYYIERFPRQSTVSELQRREFAFVMFDRDGMVRHVSFTNWSELMKFLIANVPKHVYYSSARYSDPDAPTMEEKGWLGADLIFDIDVDHIPTQCKSLHDKWWCQKCGASGWGSYEVCPRCGGEKIVRESWVCTTCLSVARDETLKLIDFLTSDFGFAEEELKVYFSGHRGFHVHIEGEEVLKLGQDERREIADYIRGLGLDPSIYLENAGRRRYTVRYPPNPGWGERIARSVYAILSCATGEELARFGVARRAADALAAQIARLASSTMDEFFSRIALPLNTWIKIFDKAVELERANIDEKVTIDIKRLIRLPYSLHGKTGFMVREFKVSDLEDPDIVRKVVAFSDEEVYVHIANPPRRVLDFNVNDKGKVRVPLYLAVYLTLNSRESVTIEPI